MGSALASALLSLAPHPFLAAAPVALPLLLALAPAAQAQTEQTLVSNLNEIESATSVSHVGIKFTTGSSAVTLTDVRIILGSVPTGSITIRIRVGSTTNPTGTIVAPLNNPATFTTEAVNTFTAPANTVLEASTTYFLEIEASRNIQFTDSTTQTGLTGWSIADNVREFLNGSWSNQTDLPNFELRGSINPPEISLMTPNLEGVSRVMNESRVPENSSRSGTTFTVSSDVNAPSGGLSVCLAISESGGDRLAATSEGVKTVTIASGSSTGTHSLPAWTNDSDSEPPSRVTLRVLAPSDSNCSSTDSYTVSADDDTVAFTILEDDNLNVAVTSADSAMIEGIATETATVTVTLARRLYAGETATVHLDLSTTTGASLPDGDGMTEDDFAVTAAGTGVTASGLDDSGPILVFTGHDTNTVQTATLTFTPTAGRSDSDTAEDTVTVAFDGNNSFIRPGDIAALTGSPANVDLTLEEPPLAPPTVSIARQGSAAVIEGANVVFRVTASRAVSANLTVNLNVGDTFNGNADFVSSTNEGSQTVTIASGAATADFTLSTEDDTTDEVDGAVGVTVNSGTGYTVGSPSSAQVTVQDNDPTRVTLSVPDATATEGSSSDRATVRLALNRALRSGESLAIPLGFSGGVLDTDFSLSLSGSPTGVALSGGTVTFNGIGLVSATTADVLLSASEDVDAVDETVTVSIPSASSGTPPILTANALLGGGATGSRTGNGEIVLSDDDTAALVFSATSLTVAEGSSGSYTVRLATQPTANVTVTVGGATGDVTVDTNSGSPGNQNTLSFTTTTWNTAQTVTVAAGEDVDTTNDSATLSHTAAGGGYNSVTGNVAVTVTDNDTAALVFSPASLTVAEGASGAYTVRLATLPTGNVTVTVGGATGDVTVDTNSGSPGNQNTLSFTTSTWNTAQTVTVAAGEDVDTTNDSATLSHTAAGGGYGSITGNVAVTVTDNDTAALVFSATSLTVAEGASGNYTVRLATQPTGNVTVTVGVTTLLVTVDTNSGSPGNQSTLTFTTTTWNTVQTVTVAAGEDDDTTNDSATLAHTASGGGYNSVTGNVAVTVTDDDTAGLVFSPTSLTVAEGSSNSYTVRLATLPTGTVTVTVGGATGDVTVDTNSGSPGNQNTLSFTTTTWNTAQTVTVAAGEDVDTTNDSATLSHSASGGGYNSVTGNVAVTVTDNDSPNTAPTVANAIADQSARAGTAFSYQFPANTFADADSDTLSYTATQGNDSALPDWLTFTEASRTFSGTPQSADVGTLSVKVTADDSNGGTVSDTFNIVVDDDGVQPVTPVNPVTPTPVVSIVREPGANIINVVTDPAPTQPVDVNIIVIDGDGNEIPDTVTIDPDTHPDGTVTVPVGPADLTIRIVPGPDYVIDPDGNSVTLPTVSITDVTEEEEEIKITVTTDPIPTEPVTVTIVVIDEDDNEITRIVTIDPETNPDGTVTVTVAVDDAVAVRIVSVSPPYRIHPTGGVVSLIKAVAVGRTQAQAWQVRFGRTVAQQVVTAVQQRFSATPQAGLSLTVAGEELTGDTPLAEHEGALGKLLGFQTVTTRQVAQDSAFSFSPQPTATAAEAEEGGTPRLSFWGQGALASFRGAESTLSLDGSVSTALLGADWRTQRWQAGAALARSWGNGSYGGDNHGDADVTARLTGLFPYGRYALTPRLGVWAVAGYGWGSLAVQPDGSKKEYNPATTMVMGAVGMDGLLIDGGAQGFSLAAVTDLLAVNTTSEEVDALPSSEGSVSRLRMGLEATHPVPLANGAALLPSLEMGIRHDGGDAESGFGLEVGAALAWNDPQRGITAEVQGRSLVTHVEEEFRQQGLALSFAWDPSPTNRGPSLAIGHTVGDAASGMDALLNPTVLEGVDRPGSTGQQFNAELAYGFPTHNNRLTLTPGLALALSRDSNTYSLLWSLTPYLEQGQTQPWEIALEGEREENTTTDTPVDHSLKLTFSLLF